ncbi:hypothetical protein M8C13_20160 [Crossiella sp. SN42]|uniref:nSTAND1 domain-containing NTPase n=1 Tax=Crossiella sp. SN42 TaxID=2944808 RepID=UPI00207D3750|nr:helix-turn-helix domain-containing protein [Crossiella sp. SN42]MCO1578071.1 hypothetical protein [Crossiella sp. SN42]
MELSTPEDFARTLDALRRKSGKSYRQLAEESGLAFTTISGYCKGRHLPQLSVGREFSGLLTAMGVSEQDAWFDALPRLRTRATPGSNPYRGLRAFQPEDAAVFFGRADLTARVLATVTDEGRLVVVGPSGSGKSSLLRAGLIPALDQAALITPGNTPLRELADVADEVVLVVDQFEELFTMCPDERDRIDFLDALLDRSAPLVLGLRADFYEQALRYPRLARLVQQAQVVVEPMTEVQLRDAIVEPARCAGFELQDGLVELLLRDTEPGALPLLSHTLQTIVQLCQEDNPQATSLGVSHYQAAGGVRGAIAKSAALAFDSLSTTQKTVARNLFLRLVKVDDSAVDTRRRVTFDELFDGRTDEEVDDLTEVFDLFVTHRLLTADKHTVEISHEALLTAWPLLQSWLANDRIGRHVHGRLTAAARVWRDNGYPAEELYRGGTLETALDWAATPGPHEALNPLEHEFLAASVDQRTAEDCADRRRVRRGYQAIIVLVVLVLVAVAAGLYARQVASSADRNERLALSRQTATKADRLRDKDPALAAQLALASYRVAPTPEARAALLDSSARPMPTRARARSGTTQVMATAGHLLASGTDTGHVEISTVDGASVAVLATGRPVAAIALTSDGAHVAAGDQTGSVLVWRVGTLTPIGTFAAGPARLFSLAFSPDGRQLAAASGDSAVRLWTIGQDTAPTVLTGPSQAVKSVVFTPDGRTVAAGSDDATVHVWPVATPGRSLVLRGPTSRVFTVAISPDGRTLAAGTAAEHLVYTWDLTAPGRPPTQLAGPASWINIVAFSPDGHTLAAGSSDTLLWQWDLRTRQPLGTLPHPVPLTGVAYRDNRTLLGLTPDGVIRTWPLPGPALVGSTNQIFSASFDASGGRLLVGAGDGSLRLWDVTAHTRPTATVALAEKETAAANLAGASVLTPDGTVAIAGSKDGRVSFWNLRARTSVHVSVAKTTIQALVLSPDGKTLAASSGDDGMVHLLDITNPDRPVVTMALPRLTPPAAAGGVRFSPNGRLLAVAGGDAKGYLWDITDRARPRLLETVTGFTGAVYATAFSSDGRLLAFGGADYSVRLVDLSRPENPVTLDAPLIGPVGEVYELAFQPGSRVLAVGSIDRTVWLWDLGNPREPDWRATLTAAEGGLFTVAFSPDGRTLAGGGRDRAVRLWNTDPSTVSARICATAGDPITPAEWAQFIPDEPYAPPCR